MCNVNIHSPLHFPPYAALFMCLWSGWEMDMVILNFSEVRCCNSVRSFETLGQDDHISVMLWSLAATHFPVWYFCFRESLSRTPNAAVTWTSLNWKETTLYFTKQKEVILYEMLTVNTSKISPQTSAYQMWTNVNLKRWLWWVEFSCCVSAVSSMEATSSKVAPALNICVSGEM